MITYKGFLFKVDLILLTGKEVSRAYPLETNILISQIPWLRTPKDTVQIGNLCIFAVEIDKRDFFWHVKHTR